MKTLQQKLVATLGIIGYVTAINAAEPADIIKTRCQACHGANMEKQALGKSMVTNTLTEEEIRKDLLGYRAKTLNKFGLGATMWGQAATLSDEEIDALAKYIPTLKK